MKNEPVGTISKRQQLFLKFTYFVFIDIVVLNLFNEFWDQVFIEYFYISVLTAILLQAFLQLTITIEHHATKGFDTKKYFSHKVKRVLATWAIVFTSKLIILEVISRVFGHQVLFGGIEHKHGLLVFIVVVVAIMAVEQGFSMIYKSLGNPQK